MVSRASAKPRFALAPTPLIFFLGFGDSALKLQFSVWAAVERFTDLQNTLHEEVKLAFDSHGIEIPFPHRSLHTSSQTEPFPVRLVDSR